MRTLTLEMRLLSALTLLLLLSGCSHSLPGPRTVDPPDDAFTEVPYPSPAAKPELVPDKPVKNAVWMDGSWKWRRKGWIWTYGGWVVQPDGVSYQPPTSKRLPDGTLWFARATWRDASGRRVAAPKILAPPQDELAIDSRAAVPCPALPPENTVAKTPTSRNEKSCGDEGDGPSDGEAAPEPPR